MHYSPACVQPPPPSGNVKFLKYIHCTIIPRICLAPSAPPRQTQIPSSPGKKLLDLRMALINVQLVGHFSVLNTFCEALRILVTCGFFFSKIVNKENDNIIVSFQYVAAFKTVRLNIFCKSFIIINIYIYLFIMINGISWLLQKLMQTV